MKDTLSAWVCGLEVPRPLFGMGQCFQQPTNPCVTTCRFCYSWTSQTTNEQPSKYLQRFWCCIKNESKRHDINSGCCRLTQQTLRIFFGKREILSCVICPSNLVGLLRRLITVQLLRCTLYHEKITGILCDDRVGMYLTEVSQFEFSNNKILIVFWHRLVRASAYLLDYNSSLITPSYILLN